MDSSAEWTANALFSPSKARAQQALAKDWAAVDAWLSKKYGSKRLPTFERNEDVLQILLTLANLNETADERRSYVERVEKAALQSITKPLSQFEDTILKSLLGYFSNEDHLETLAAVSVGLDCTTASSVEMATKLIELDSARFEASQALARSKSQLVALQAEQEHMSTVLKQLQSDSFKTPPALLEDTAEWTKSAKQLKAKVAEYDERLIATKAGSTSATSFDRYLQLARDVETGREQLEAQNVALNAYQNLPSHPETAQTKIEAAREQLRKAVATREKLFENMTDG